MKNNTDNTERVNISVGQMAIYVAIFVGGVALAAALNWGGRSLQIKSLEEKYQKLESEYSQLKKDYDSLSEDNTPKEGTVHEGQTTIDDNSSDSHVSSDQESQKGQDLLSVCPPYETRNYSAPESIRIMGVEYKNSFWLTDNYRKAYAYFNLDKKYSELKFKIGHVDGSSMDSRTLKVYVDEELQNIDLSPDMVIMDYTISVKGKTQIRMIIEEADGDPKYGIVEAYLY